MRNRSRAKAPAVSIATFAACFPDEASCLTYMFYTRHGFTPPCPACGEMTVFRPVRGQRSFASRCCRARLHPVSGSILGEMRLPLRMWFYALLLYTDVRVGLSGNEISRLLGIPTSTAAIVTDRIRTHMALLQRDHPIGGAGVKIYADEARVWIGHTRQQMILFGLTDGVRCIIRVVPNRSRWTLFPILRRLVVPGSILVTDSFGGYRDLDLLDLEHSKVNHQRKQWVNAAGDSNAPAEALWRITKRVLRGRTGQISQDNLWKFLGEIMYRYNAGLDPAAAWWHLISSFRTIGPADIERARQRIDLRGMRWVAK